MQKLEIHIFENELDNLAFLEKQEASIISYHKLKAKSNSGFQAHREPLVNVELFMQKIPDSLLGKINEVDSVIDVFLSDCYQLAFEDIVKAESEQVYKPNQVEEENPIYIDAVFSFKVKNLRTGKQRLTIQTNRTTYFLFRVLVCLHRTPFG